jgi:RNA polymerase sigma factor (sigma-70 family)
MDAPDNNHDDATLIARCRAGDGAAWAALVKRYQRLVYTVVLRTGMDEHAAADVFQTVFQRLMAHLQRIDQPERLQAWIVTTAKREALRERERSRRTVSMSRNDDDDDTPAAPGLEDTLADDAPLAEDALSDLQQLDRLRAGLDRLDARCRDLLLLTFRDDDDKLPYDEVARRLAMPVGSIGPTRSRCLGKLRTLVQAEGGGG